MLSNDIKENLLATGNAGRFVELEPHTPGEKVPSLVSIDKLTNRLEAVPLNKLTVSQNLKGVELSPEQQQALNEGKKVLVEGMTFKNTYYRFHFSFLLNDFSAIFTIIFLLYLLFLFISPSFKVLIVCSL